jgi:hypothetical protein
MFMSGMNSNSVSIAGEFAVLTQLTLNGYDANMTLGQTKSIDILAAHQHSGRMLKIEVKTTMKEERPSPGNIKSFGQYEFTWMMGEKHERLVDADLFYWFVYIAEDRKNFRFFIVPSKVVAQYVRVQHQVWLDEKESRSRENTMRTFRIGIRGRSYPLPTPLAEDYEDNWGFKA